MKRSAVVIDQEYLKHLPGGGHPESPARVQVLLDFARTLDKQRFQLLPPRPATRDEITTCHSEDYLRLLESTSKTNQYALDGDTMTCRDSFGVALLAAGGFLRLLDSVAAGESENGFALVRPPGHHALRDRTMGFCLLNTVAIGAHYLKSTYGARRIMIMDWDVHHGNGTQEAFYDDPSVLFLSTHQYPYYPGTGAIHDVGRNTGEGYTINVPLPAGCADQEYLDVFREIVTPAARGFEPEWILVSAGFDPHRHDPLGGMGVTEEGFAGMAGILSSLAYHHSGGRIAFVLECGYNLSALRNSVAAVLNVMQREPADDDNLVDGPEHRLRALIRKVVQVHEKYSFKNC